MRRLQMRRASGRVVYNGIDRSQRDHVYVAFTEIPRHSDHKEGLRYDQYDHESDQHQRFRFERGLELKERI